MLSLGPFILLKQWRGKSAAKIIQSCNGLLLCASLNRIIQNYFVYNPPTKKYAIVPDKPGLQKKSISISRLVFYGKTVLRNLVYIDLL